VVALSTLAGAGLDRLAPWLQPGRTVALLGSSGVGKSTLVNALLGADLQPVRSIGVDGRGRHTTTTRQLRVLPGGGLLIDTPGLREVGLWGDGEGLARAFADVEELAAACRFADCAHAGEPGCQVAAAVADGRLDAERLASWGKLQRELAYLARRQDVQLQQAEKRRWKAIHKALKRRPHR
jgi:ribosome biogenesis GTPase